MVLVACRLLLSKQKIHKKYSKFVASTERPKTKRANLINKQRKLQ